MSLKSILRGTGVAIVTPFNREQSPDLPAYKKLIEYLIGNRVEYIVVLGTTGETPVLSKEEKIKLANATYEYVNGRVPVVVGIGGNHTAAVAEELKTFPLKGATAVLSAAPYYNKPTQEGLFQHYKALAEASPLPLILYNVPGRTGRNMEAHTTLRLAHEVPNIAGIKEASGNMEQCMEILRDRPDDFLVVSGDDPLAMSQISCGMEGVISVAANAFPAEFAEMIRLSLSGNFTGASLMNSKLLEAYNLMFAENNPAGIKAFLSEMGLIENVLRLPLVPLSEKLHKQVVRFLEKHQQVSV